jgi:MFS transporter, FHS family, glucose/mannose:H+ symporter
MPGRILAHPMRPSAPLVTIVLHIGFVVAGMATTLLGPILPALTERWRMSDVVAGSLFTAQFLSAMTATLVAPALAGRIGARGALALGFTLLAMGIVTIGLAPHAIGVLATVVYGLGLGFVLPLTNIAVAAAQPDRAASALNLVNVSWGVGAVIWPIAVRSLGSVESVAAPTSALAMACAVMAIACRVVIPAALLSVRRSTDGADHGGAKAPPPQLSPKAEALSPQLPRHATKARSSMVGRAVLLGTLIFLYVGTENAVAGWVAEFAHRMVAGATTTWALAPTAFWAALTTGRLLAAVALRRITESALIRSGLVLATLGVVAITFAASTPGGVIAGAAATGLGLSAIFPLLWALVTRSVGALAPAAAGPLYAAGGLGGAVMPWVVGAVSSAVDDLRAGLVVPLGALLVLLALSSLKASR